MFSHIVSFARSGFAYYFLSFFFVSALLTFFFFICVVLKVYADCICLHFLAAYRVVRNQGNYGNVSVSWAVDPACTNDIYPEQGTIFFDNLEFSKNITIYSLPDEVNIFTVFLCEFMGQKASAKTLQFKGKEGMSGLKKPRKYL